MSRKTGNPRGRPPGSKNQRALALINGLVIPGEDPLDVILYKMRYWFDRAKAEIAKGREGQAAKCLQQAEVSAAKAAPYIHPRLATIEHRGGVDVRDLARLGDDDLAELARLRSVLALAGDDPAGDSAAPTIEGALSD